MHCPVNKKINKYGHCEKLALGQVSFSLWPRKTLSFLTDCDGLLCGRVTPAQQFIFNFKLNLTLI